MKIGCACGAAIVDQMDDLPYKARLLPDQDREDFMDAMERLLSAVAAGSVDVERAKSEAWSAMRHWSAAYECRACGRLHIDRRDGTLREYLPARGGAETESIFVSARGESCPGRVIALWRTQGAGGEGLWCTHNGPRGGFRRFHDLVALESEYRRVVEELRREGLLRTALFSKDGEIIESC